MDFIRKPYSPELILSKIRNINKLISGRRAERLIVRDNLTDLYNMPSFIYKSECLLRDTAEEYYMIKFNINDFKLINSKLGHEQGNRLLRIIGEELGAVTDEKTLAARLYGDRFIVLARDAGIINGPAERMIGRINLEFHIKVSIRVGIVGLKI